MELVLKSGVPVPKEKLEEKKEEEEKKKDEKEKTIYVCELHPEEVFDKPGKCFKGSCNGMELEPRKIVPGARLVYVCPDHPDVVTDKPGECPRDKKKLHFKIVSDTSRLTHAWTCLLHPEHAAAAKGKCPACGLDRKHLEIEQLLAVPFSAVIDTGVRKVVFIERSLGLFDAVAVELGPRAGDFYPALKGLAAGDRVVTQGAFLLDAETRLNPAAAAAYFGAAGTETKK